MLEKVLKGCKRHLSMRRNLRGESKSCSTLHKRCTPKKDRILEPAWGQRRVLKAEPVLGLVCGELEKNGELELTALTLWSETELDCHQLAQMKTAL
jgi:hypothetical protein